MRSSTWILLACVAFALVAPILATEQGDDDFESFETETVTFQGKMSTFGGPNDRGVSPSEGAYHDYCYLRLLAVLLAALLSIQAQNHRVTENFPKHFSLTGLLSTWVQVLRSTHPFRRDPSCSCPPNRLERPDWPAD